MLKHIVEKFGENEKNIGFILGNISFVFVLLGFIFSLANLVYISKINNLDNNTKLITLSLTMSILIFLCFLALIGMSIGMYTLSNN